MFRSIKFVFRRLVIWSKYRHVRFLSVGAGCVYKTLTSSFAHAERISLGNNVHIGPFATLDGAGGIYLGSGTILAPEVKVYSRSHNFDQDVQALPFDNVMHVAAVHIGEYVWIGANAIILPGVQIGDGAVIGAGAVVSRNVPECGVAVGNPAKVVRFRDRERFTTLRSTADPFVYTKFGHGKIFRTRARLAEER